MNIKSTVYPEGYDISKLNTPCDPKSDVEFGKWYNLVMRKAKLIKEKKVKNTRNVTNPLGSFRVEGWVYTLFPQS